MSKNNMLSEIMNSLSSQQLAGLIEYYKNDDSNSSGGNDRRKNNRDEEENDSSPRRRPSASRFRNNTPIGHQQSLSRSITEREQPNPHQPRITQNRGQRSVARDTPAYTRQLVDIDYADLLLDSTLRSTARQGYSKDGFNSVLQNH